MGGGGSGGIVGVVVVVDDGPGESLWVFAREGGG